MTDPGALVVTRIEVLTGAGRGVEALLAALGRDLTSPAPWRWPGLRAERVVLVPDVGVAPGAPGRAEALLAEVVGAVAPVDEACGLVVGTASGALTGGLEAAREATPEGPLPGGWRHQPTAAVAAAWGMAPARTVSVACASGAAAFVVAATTIARGIVPRVVVAGVDALPPFVHAGFAGLGALTAGACRPFAATRDGLLLGEGAAALLVETLASARAAGRVPLAGLRGWGLSQDAVHLTAPDRTGGGLARAARMALARAGLPPEAVDVVSAHGTATAFNDAMEARALAAVFGDRPLPLHALKATTGHTMGAAGAIEAAVVVAALAGAPVPPPPAEPDPELPLSLAPAPAHPRVALSVNAAFGGVNAALVFGPPAAAPAPPAPTRLAPEVEARGADFPLATLLAGAPAPPTLGRADRYVRAGVAALAAARPPADAAVVLSTDTGCHAADLAWLDDLRRLGPERASRARFVYTIPGAPLAEASILLGLRGPALVLVGEPGPDPALAAALSPTAVALHVEAPADSAMTRLALVLPP